jgi:hypothetical protein
MMLAFYTGTNRKGEDLIASGRVELPVKETQARLWWMEVIRGVLTITFGLLFIFIDVRFFIYALGIYLIFDGTSDIYKVATGKRASKRKVLSSWECLHKYRDRSDLPGVSCLDHLPPTHYHCGPHYHQ